MKVLIVGSGGREHAMAWKIARSCLVGQVLVAPGNDGIKQVADCVAIAEDDQDALLSFARKEQIDLTIIGAEQPLAAGIVNKFQQAGLAVFGPTKEAALIESSKSFAKDLMQKYRIPTAQSATFTSYDEACMYVEAKGAPIVIKADGLAAGKGVCVAQTTEQALESLREMMVADKFGHAGSKVVIEDYLTGGEFSLMALVCGETVCPLAASRDHKRAFDGDRGPNTGGMGAYSPVPQLADHTIKQAYQKILQPAASGLMQENRPFTGVLYAGLIDTVEGPKVIEFNARFGDPETQVVLPRLQDDLIEVIQTVLTGKPVSLQWSDDAVLGVVLASCGYPGPYEKGTALHGFEALAGDTLLFHAASKHTDDGWVGDGGRILLAARRAPTLTKAQTAVYHEMKHLHTDGTFYRTDIGPGAVEASMTVRGE